VFNTIVKNKFGWKEFRVLYGHNGKKERMIILQHHSPIPSLLRHVAVDGNNVSFAIPNVPSTKVQNIISNPTIPPSLSRDQKRKKLGPNQGTCPRLWIHFKPGDKLKSPLYLIDLRNILLYFEDGDWSMEGPLPWL
jgi:hypothetical protein